MSDSAQPTGLKAAASARLALGIGAIESNRRSAFTIFGLLCLSVGMLATSTGRTLALNQTHSNEIEFLGDIVAIKTRLIAKDEALAVAAQLFVTSGDEQWQENYNRTYEQLEEDYRRFSKLKSDEEFARSMKIVERLRIQIAETEAKAFEAIDDRDRYRSSQILFDPEYLQARSQLREVMSGLMDRMVEDLNSLLVQTRKEAREAKLTLFGSLLLFFAAIIWAAVMARGAFRRLKASLKLEERRRQQFEELSQSLEVKVAERTDALSKTLESARAASREKTRFLAAMSHELRTPLNAVLGYTQLIERAARKRQDTALLDDLGEIKRAGKHVLSLVSDILDLSKIESGSFELQSERFSVMDCVQEVLAAVRPQFDHSKSQLLIEVLPNDLQMHTDRRFLKQCLVNLMGNAAKFTVDGNVELRIEKLGEDGHSVAFSILDTGVGIPDSGHSQIFTPFYQSKEGAQRQGSSGLGLAITSRLVHLMNGEIGFRSQSGLGSMFVFVLPVVLEPGGLPPSSASLLETVLGKFEDRLNELRFKKAG